MTKFFLVTSLLILAVVGIILVGLVITSERGGGFHSLKGNSSFWDSRKPTLDR